MSKQKLIFYTSLLVLAFAITKIFPEKEQVKAPIKPIVYYKDEAKIKDLITKETNVQDLTFPQPGWVYVGMYTKGDRKDGFAEYLCLTIRPYLLENVSIKIVDYKDVLQKKGFTEIGLARCSKN